MRDKKRQALSKTKRSCHFFEIFIAFFFLDVLKYKKA